MAQNTILFGDSDISRWPPSLYPSLPSGHSKVSNHGESGAELADLLQQIDQWKVEILEGRKINNVSNGNAISTDSHVFVCCAGENDIGFGKSLDQTLETFRVMLDKLFPPSDATTNQQLPCNSKSSKMIFLGPKLEPWLMHDNASRKQYAKLNNGLQRGIRKHHACNRMVYIDCLTLFCTKETSAVPGAVYGGKAMPDAEYFDGDGLHLNEVGYCVWKQLVEEQFRELDGT